MKPTLTTDTSEVYVTRLFYIFYYIVFDHLFSEAPIAKPELPDMVLPNSTRGTFHLKGRNGKARLSSPLSNMSTKQREREDDNPPTNNNIQPPPEVFSLDGDTNTTQTDDINNDDTVSPLPIGVQKKTFSISASLSINTSQSSDSDHNELTDSTMNDSTDIQIIPPPGSSSPYPSPTLRSQTRSPYMPPTPTISAYRVSTGPIPSPMPSPSLGSAFGPNIGPMPSPNFLPSPVPSPMPSPTLTSEKKQLESSGESSPFSPRRSKRELEQDLFDTLGTFYHSFIIIRSIVMFGLTINTRFCRKL